MILPHSHCLWTYPGEKPKVFKLICPIYQHDHLLAFPISITDSISRQKPISILNFFLILFLLHPPLIQSIKNSVSIATTISHPDYLQKLPKWPSCFYPYYFPIYSLHSSQSNLFTTKSNVSLFCLQSLP
jgi:hypothetical protein